MRCAGALRKEECEESAAPSLGGDLAVQVILNCRLFRHRFLVHSSVRHYVYMGGLSHHGVGERV